MFSGIVASINPDQRDDSCLVRQKEALGLGHAVLMARELVGGKPVAVLR
jgi:UTP-glucose-1-phosphate uridylyltransferase